MLNSSRTMTTDSRNMMLKSEPTARSMIWEIDGYQVRLPSFEVLTTMTTMMTIAEAKGILQKLIWLKGI